MAKTPFELTASALKIMGKKVASKKDSHAVTMCVFIPNGDTHAIATDGNIIALLDLNKYENLSKHGILEELAFYADMQVINYMNGAALITAEKKENFVNEFKKGIDDPSWEELEQTYLPFPEIQKILPPAESLQNSSATGAIFRPSEIGLLDSVAIAFDVAPIGTETIIQNLYGADSEGFHIACLNGLMLAAKPLHPNKENIEVVPSKKTIQSFFKATEPEQTEMKFEESDNE